MNLTRKSIEYSLFLIFGTVLFQSIFFLCNGSVSVLPLILSTIAWIVYCKKIQNGDTKEIILSIIIVIAMILVLNTYFSVFNETTYDGAYYHGNAIVEMLNGWNPFYEANNYEVTGVTIWADYYPKATWIFSAVLVKLTGNLSSGMVLNTLVTFMTTAYAFLFMKGRKTSTLTSVLVALVFFMNPITLEQTHTYYVDAQIGNWVALLLMIGIEIIEEYDFHKNFLIYMISVLLINIKFSSFGFAGILNLFIWIYFLIKDRKAALYYMFFGVAMVLTGVMVVGFSPYFVNILNLRHIFYPIAGKDAQDVVTYLIPDYLVGKNPVYKLIYSIFHGMDIKANLLDFSNQGYLLYDERVGAFGNMFGKLVVLCSGIYACYCGKLLYKKKLNLGYCLAFIGLTVSILANYKNIWWFRYAPQIWLFICVAIWMLSKTKFKIISGLIVGLVLFQGYHIFYNTFTTDYAKSRSIEEFYDKYQGQDITVQIKANDLTDIYWFDAYEKQRALQMGINMTIYHDEEVKNPDDCHFMHAYKVCPVEK